MEAVVVALGVVFIAELGDKSQLIALTFAARGRPLAVLAGIAVAAGILQALAVGAGAAISETFPERPVELAAGAAFLVFAVLTVRGRDADVDEQPPRAARAVAVAAGTAFFAAELGDKTQLATLALASANGAVGTWIGAVFGVVAADAVAVAVGARIGTRLPARTLRVISAGVFAVFGVLLLAGVG